MNKVIKTSDSGTTDANGYLNLSISTDYIILGVAPNDNAVSVKHIYRASTGVWWAIFVNAATDAPIASTNVGYRVAYV